MENHLLTENQYKAIINASLTINDMIIYYINLESKVPLSGKKLDYRYYSYLYKNEIDIINNNIFKNYIKEKEWIPVKWIYDLRLGWKNIEELNYCISNFNYVVFSITGRWGLFFEKTGFSIIGGDKEFIELIKKYYPEYKQDRIDFLSEADYEWAKEYLDYCDE